MRKFLLTCGLGLSLFSAAAQGFRAPRRFLDNQNRIYHRPPLTLSLGFNGAYYNGDITSRYADNTSRLGLTLGAVRTLSPRVSLAFDLGYFRLQARDFNPQRGFAFQGTSYLGTALLRVNLLADRSLYLGQHHRATPVLLFVEGGLAAFSYEPSLRQGNEFLPPEPREEFFGLAGALPFGGGLTLRPAPRLGLTFEALYFFTSTDLLDGVSQRGNPNTNDSFATGTIKLEWTLARKRGKPLARPD